MLIVILSFGLMYEAISRMVNGIEAIDAWVMFGTAVFGLICNLAMMKVLHGGGHSHSDDDHGHEHGHDHHSHEHGHDEEQDHNEHEHKHAEKNKPAD